MSKRILQIFQKGDRTTNGRIDFHNHPLSQLSTMSLQNLNHGGMAMLGKNGDEIMLARECSSSSGGVRGRGQTRTRAEFEKSSISGGGAGAGATASVSGVGVGTGASSVAATGTDHSSYEGMPNTRQLVRTEFQLLNALGRRPNSSGYSNNDEVRSNSGSYANNGEIQADVEYEYDEDETDEHLQERLILAANRGKYRCSRCGAPKTNHNCPVVEQYTISGCSQYEPVTLSSAEFNSTYVSKSADASSSSIASISIAHCLRLLPVRSDYVPAVPAHALRKPSRVVLREPTTADAAAAVHPAGQADAVWQPASTPRVISSEEYVVDEGGMSSVNAILRLPPGLVYIPVPTALLQNGLHLTATSSSGEAVGVYSLVLVQQDKGKKKKEKEKERDPPASLQLSFQPAMKRTSSFSSSSSAGAGAGAGAGGSGSGTGSGTGSGDGMTGGGERTSVSYGTNLH